MSNVKGLEVNVKIGDMPLFSDLLELLSLFVDDTRIPAEVKEELSERVSALLEIHQPNSDLSHLKSLDADKRQWLEQNGYRPITEAIMHEWMGYTLPELSERMYWEAKNEFVVYKRYGKTVMPYSERYLAEKSIEELMFKGGKNVFPDPT